MNVGYNQREDNATLRVDSSVAAETTVDFAGSPSTLALTTPLKFLGTIAGFAAGDDIDLLSTPATQLVFSTSTDKLLVKNGAKTVARLQLSGNYAASGFSLTESGSDSHIGYTAPQAAQTTATPAMHHALGAALFEATFSHASISTAPDVGHTMAAEPTLNAASQTFGIKSPIG